LRAQPNGRGCKLSLAFSAGRELPEERQWGMTLSFEGAENLQSAKDLERLLSHFDHACDELRRLRDVVEAIQAENRALAERVDRARVAGEIQGMSETEALRHLVRIDAEFGERNEQLAHRIDGIFGMLKLMKHKLGNFGLFRSGAGDTRTQ
jgi:hypothetical protein